MTGTLGAWAGIAIAEAAFALLLTGLWLLGPTEAEGRRKLFHLGAGLIALSLPWLMADRWCAVVLVSVTSTALVGLRVVPALRATVGAALHGVGRRSHGEFYFALAVLAVYLAAPSGGPRYEIPIVILTVADPLAALVGISRGRRHLTRWAGAKTVEGCLACCLSTLVVTAALLMSAGLQLSAAAWIATVVAVAVTTAEAIGVDGSDNFLVPAAAYVVVGPLVSGTVVPALFTAMAVTGSAWLTIGLVGPAPRRRRRTPGAGWRPGHLWERRLRGPA